MKFSNTFILFLLLIFVSSCAFHDGIYVSSASLNQANFKVVDQAYGNSASTKVLGLGVLAYKALVLSAKENMHRTYPLKDNQVFANVTVDFQRRFIFTVNTNTCTVSADVIEFTNEVNSNTLPETRKQFELNASNFF